MWLKIAIYVLIVFILLLLAYCAWFASVWGFNPLAIFPLYFLGLVVCGLLFAASLRIKANVRL